MLTDTHCHLDFHKFDEDRNAVIQRALDAGVTRIMIPALDYESSRAAIKLAESHPNIFAAVGFHPTDLDQWDENSIENLRNLFHPHPSPLPSGEGTPFPFGGRVGDEGA
jgi:TatD DNase family protein